MKIADFFATLGFKIEKKGVAQFENNLRQVRNGFAVVTAAATASLYAIDRFIESSVRGASELANFNQQTGLSIQKLQEWQSVAIQTNPLASTQDVMSSVQAIQNQLTQIRLGGGNLRPFQLLGIDILGSDAFTVLDQLRDRLKGLSRPVATNLMQELGISPQMIQALTTSNEEFKKLSGSFVRSKATTMALAKLNIQITKFKNELLLTKDNLVAEFVPALQSLVSFLKRVGNTLNFFYEGFKRIFELGERFPNVSGVIIASLVAISAALAPVTASILGLILLLDDFAVYMSGGKSVIGSNIEAIGKVFEKIGQKIKKVFEDIMNSSFVKGFMDLAKTIENMIPNISVKGNVSSSNPDWYNMMVGGKTGTSLPASLVTPQNNFNNNFNIQSTANANEIVDLLIKEQKRQLNYTTQDFNRGSEY